MPNIDYPIGNKNVLDSVLIKIAKLEQELDDYKNIMSTVNINQEIKVPVIGYSHLSLPKTAANWNMSVGLKGMSLKNELNYNKDTWAEWFASGGSITKRDINGIEVTYNNNPAMNGPLYLATNTIKKQTKYLILFKVIANTLNISSYVRFGTNLGGVGTVANFAAGFIGNYKAILTTSQDTITTFRIGVNDIADGARTVAEVRIHELPPDSQIETDANNLTADQLVVKYPYVRGDGIKSTPCAGRVKSVGKNVIDWKEVLRKNTQITKTTYSGKEALMFANGSEAQTIRINEKKFKPNTQYRISGKYIELNGSANLYFRYTDGTYDTIVLSTASTWTNFGVTSSAGKSINYIQGVYTDASRVTYLDIDSLQLEEGTVSTAVEPYKDSYQYFTVTENGQIAEARSLPNGVRDKIDLKESKLTLSTKKKILEASDITALSTTPVNINNVVIKMPIANNGVDLTSKYLLEDYPYKPYLDDVANIGASTINNIANRELRVTLAKGTTLDQARTALAGKALIYQLAEQIEIPVEVSGTLLSYPSGTVYYEKAVADAGIYSGGISVLHQDLPIKELEKISKVDFMTGLETELNVATAVISGDKKSFTHSGLTNNDIVFFTYFYDREGTEPEITAEFYDSRYIVTDSVNGKLYQYKINSANAIASIGLTEV